MLLLSLLASAVFATELIGFNQENHADGSLAAITFKVPNHDERGIIGSRLKDRPSYPATLNYKGSNHGIQLSCQRGLECNCQIVVKENDQLMNCNPSKRHWREGPMGECHVRIHVKELFLSALTSVPSLPSVCFPVAVTTLEALDERIEHGEILEATFTVPNQTPHGMIGFGKTELSHSARLIQKGSIQDIRLSCQRGPECNCQMILEPSLATGGKEQLVNCKTSTMSWRDVDTGHCYLRVLVKGVFWIAGTAKTTKVCYPVKERLLIADSELPFSLIDASTSEGTYRRRSSSSSEI